MHLPKSWTRALTKQTQFRIRAASIGRRAPNIRSEPLRDPDECRQNVDRRL
jgi:hypothetical protein